MEMHSYESDYRYLNHEYFNLLLPTRRFGDSQHLFVLLLVKYSKIYEWILMKLSGSNGPKKILAMILEAMVEGPRIIGG